MRKQVTIVTIPLVCYHETLYWCLYNQYSGKVREDLLNRPAGGKQVPFAFNQALLTQDDILILVDDKFNFERDKYKKIPTDAEVKKLIEKHPLPEVWLDALTQSNKMSCIVAPPSHLKCTPYSFSEKKLVANAEYGLPGECANEWAALLDYLERGGYQAINAYIPKICAKGVCYATPYAKEAGIWVKPIRISFTDKDRVSSVYGE